MGLLDWFSRSDRSQSWGAATVNTAVLGLRDMSLCGVRIGAPADELSRFGAPSNNKPFARQSFAWRDIGITVDIDTGHVSYFGVVAIAMEDPRIDCRPFELILPDGRSVTIDGATTGQQLLSSLPAPYKIDRDSEEIIYFINLNNMTIEIECAPVDRVQRINVLRP